VARILDLPARAVSRADETEEEGEMLRLLELEEAEGDIEEDERKMIRGVFGLEDTTVREIMTPRTDIACASTFPSAGAGTSIPSAACRRTRSSPATSRSTRSNG